MKNEKERIKEETKKVTNDEKRKDLENEKYRILIDLR